MICEIGNEIIIQDPTPEIVKWFEHQLTFANPDYIKKERMGFWVGNTPKNISLMWRRGNQIGIPFGCLKKIGSRKAEFSAIVNRVSRPLPMIDYQSGIKLYDYQQEAVEAALLKGNGVIVAPCGSGKTQMGLEIAARIGGRTLWLTHTQDLLTQSMNRAKAVFGLPETEYGTITAGKVNVRNVITFATVQTMSKMDLSIVRESFDTVIVDEAHHCVGSPGKVQMFWRVVSGLCARRKIGLTATPTRQDGLIGCMYALLGDTIYTVTAEQVKQNLCDVEVHFVNTEYVPDYNVVLSSDGTLQYTALINDIVYNAERNKRIVEHIKSVPGTCLVLTDRVSHAVELHNALDSASNCFSSILTGKVSKNEREAVLGQIRRGERRILVATYALAQEGLDIPCLDNVFMTTPRKDSASVIQSAGRVARKFKGKTVGRVWDYVDDFGMLRGWAKKRAGFYKKAGYYIAL